jgi:alkylated DNA repair dioxygenase AlkB
MERWIYNEDRIINNILPKDGTVNYYGRILTLKQSNLYLNLLLQNILWQNDHANIFGKNIITKRKVAWYGDSNYLYTYSNTTKQALEWTRELSYLKQIVEKKLETKFNSCLLNLYHDGNEGVGWHSDDEKSLGKNTIIGSLSFGAERKFLFRHKQTKQEVSIILEHGSLLVMKDATQSNWLHSLPKSKKITGTRINLMFRTIM